jgi:hypothetical protein
MIEGRFIYSSSDKTTRIQQKKLRQEEAVRKAATGLPTDAEAVAILVERIKHPDLSIEDFSKRLSKGGSRFSDNHPELIDAFHAGVEDNQLPNGILDRYQENKDYEKMIEQIDHYWIKLFADPITVDTPEGKVTFQPQRTNNLLERFFRDIKRNHRRKSGTNSMSRKLRAMLADTPLVKNLENEDYLNILLNGKVTLEELFSEIDVKIIRKELSKSQNDSEIIPAKIRSLIRKPNLPQIITDLFLKAGRIVKSN